MIPELVQAVSVAEPVNKNDVLWSFVLYTSVFLQTSWVLSVSC